MNRVQVHPCLRSPTLRPHKYNGRMDTTRSSVHAPLFVAAVLAVLLIAHVSGFYLLGTIGTSGPVRFHVYRSQWLSVLFTPAAKVESLILGCEVYAAHTEE